MRILLASDSWKYSLRSWEICAIAERVITDHTLPIDLDTQALADGGEGSLQVLADTLSLEIITLPTVDALHRPISATYGIKNNTAYIEMAQASGIERLDQSELNILKSSTYGTGLLIRDAQARDIHKIYLLVGSSATCDLGMGMAQALGFDHLDAQGDILPAGACHMESVDQILPPPGPFPEIEILYDVRNPLLGPRGTAAIYAPQKGASPADIQHLERGLSHLSRHLASMHGGPIHLFPGAGAAGGIAAGGVAYLGAHVVSGAETLLKYLDMDRRIAEADYVISGEGSIDAQSMDGKLIGAIAQKCKKYNTPLYLICGRTDISPDAIAALTIKNIYSVLERAENIDQSIAESDKILYGILFQLFRDLPS